MAVVLMPVEQGRPIILDKAIVFIGRHPGCDVVLKRSRKVSRKHCCIAQVDDQLLIRDLGSLNGVRVNGQRVQKEQVLKLDDEVTIGDLRYVVRSQNGRPQSAPPDADGRSEEPDGRAIPDDADPVAGEPAGPNTPEKTPDELPKFSASDDDILPLPEDDESDEEQRPPRPPLQD